MGNHAEASQEGLIAGVGIDSTNDGSIDFEIVQTDVVEFTDPRDAWAGVFQADSTSRGFKGMAEVPEGFQVVVCAMFGNLQPQGLGKLGVGMQAIGDHPRELRVADRFQ